jgi:hypothetical protein
MPKTGWNSGPMIARILLKCRGKTRRMEEGSRTSGDNSISNFSHEPDE